MKNLELIENVSTSRFKFRLINENDAQDVYEILENENVIQNLNMDIHTKIEDSNKLIKEYLESYKEDTKLPLVILNKETDEFLGVFLIKLDLYNEDAFEFTVYIKEKFWNRGIYSEVLPQMTKLAFDVVDTKNFRGYVMEKNISSAKVLERSGFMLEKIFDVPGIDGKIKSYLITKEMYENKIS